MFPLLMQFLQYPFYQNGRIAIFSGASIDTDSFYSIPPYGVVLIPIMFFSPVKGIDSCHFVSVQFKMKQFCIFLDMFRIA